MIKKSLTSDHRKWKPSVRIDKTELNRPAEYFECVKKGAKIR